MQNKPQILLTGASGNLGRAVERRLTRQGLAIVSAFRSSMPNETAINRIPEKIIQVQCDLSDRNQTLEKMAKYRGSLETIIHLAGMLPHKNAKYEEYWRNNVEATRNILEFAASCPSVSTFIFASTMKVYGKPAYLPVDSAHRLDPKSDYAKSKMQAEMLLAEHAAKNGTSAVCFRLPSLFGPGIAEGALYNFVKAALEGQNLRVSLNGEAWDILHLDDAAEAIFSACEIKAWKKGTLNIVNPDYGEEIEIGKIARRVVKLCDSDSKIAVNGNETAPFFYRKQSPGEKIRFKNASLGGALKKYIADVKEKAHYLEFNS